MAKAGSQEAFYKIDYTYTYQLAELAAKGGASQFLLVRSSVAKGARHLRGFCFLPRCVPP